MNATQLATPFARLWQGVGHAMQTWATRQSLCQLDDRMLKDLGISRAQAEFEASRSSWQGAWHIGPHRGA
jgi:uncharacterized protein YjiS (DUF1127 family)